MSSCPEKEVEKLLISIIPDSPWANRVFSVGGFVRDDLLGIESKDLDLVVEELHGSERLAKYIKSLFPNEVSNPYKIGAHYPIWHLKVMKDITWNGQVFGTKDAEVDIADTQRESSSGSRSLEFGTLIDDVSRRDFTVNMLLRDASTGKVIDPSGVGMSDLQQGVLRTQPGVEGTLVFEADPLRILRLIRLKLKYGWNIEENTLESARTSGHLIQRVSQERIRDELIKVMEYGKLGLAIQWMDQIGVLGSILPEVLAMKGIEQDQVHHSEGDVYTHTLLLLEKANPGVIPQLSALLHDVGKPKTQSIHLPENSHELRRIKFLNHENVGSEMSEGILKRMKFDNSVVEKVTKIIRFHLRAHFSKDWSFKAVRKFIRDCGDDLDSILHISEIDSQSSYGPDGKVKDNLVSLLRKKINDSIQIPIKKKTILNGEEVMNLLSLKPGKEVGEALLILQDIEDEFAGRGVIINREEAIRELKTRFPKMKSKPT